MSTRCSTRWNRPKSPDHEAPGGTFQQQVGIPFYIRHSGIRGVGPAFVLTGGHLYAVVVGADGEDRIKVWRVLDGS